MKLKLRFFKASEIDRNIKATVHASGKLGFSSGAIGKLKFNENKSIALAENEDDQMDNNMYGVLYKDVNEDAFKIIKSGDYYYINTKTLFDQIGIDYKRDRIIYDIIITQYEGEEIVKFIRRDLKKKKKELE